MEASGRKYKWWNSTVGQTEMKVAAPRANIALWWVVG
jgi:hypothetical protein